MTKKTDPASDAPSNDSASNEDIVPFEQLLERLSQVADSLEKSDVPLEKALALYEEGVNLARRAEARLTQAEARIEELTQSGQTVPLEAAPKKR
jgi:exodeoxyribonuclease VII small subunit